MAKFHLDPLNPPKLSEEAAARMNAMTPAEIEANAATDIDNPPLTDTELARLAAARLAKAARDRSGLSQAQFAARYHINVSRLRDLERGRFRQPDSALVAYLSVIKSDPDAVLRAIETIS